MASIHLTSTIDKERDETFFYVECLYERTLKSAELCLI